MEPKIYYSHVETIYNKFGDDLPRLCRSTWPELCELLEATAQIANDPVAKLSLDPNITTAQEFYKLFGTQKWDYEIPSLMSAIYTENSSRDADNVEYWGNLAIADIDDVQISFEDLIELLDHLDINYFLNTTTSHSEVSPHYRVHFPLDRTMDIAEIPDLWNAVYLMLDKMPDERTKGLSRLMFMPQAWIGVNNKYHFVTERKHLGVDEVISKYPSAKRKVRVSLKEVTAIEGTLSSSTVVNLSDFQQCKYVTESAFESYNRPKGGRFFGSLNRIAFNALRSGYNITPQELFDLGLQIEARLSGDIENRNISEAIKAKKYAMANVIAFNRFDVETVPEDFKPPVNVKKSGMKAFYIDAGCGDGKTYAMLDQMATIKGKYVYACDKIVAINERVDEFNGRLNDHYMLEGDKRPIGQTTAIEVIYSGKKGKNIHGIVEEVDDAARVTEKIARAKKKIETDYQLGVKNNAVIFISHAAMKMMNWKEWDDWEIIIDETPDITETYNKTYTQSSDGFLTKYLKMLEQDKETYILGLTPLGRKYVDEGNYDDAVNNIDGLLQVAGDPNTKLWVLKDGWDAYESGVLEDDKDGFSLTFFSLFSHHTLKPFKARYFLGDQFLRSKFKMAWENIENVDFRPAPLWNGGRKRKCLLKDRVTVTYFCDDNASFNRFKNYDRPLSAVTEWLVRNVRVPLLYSCNDKFQTHMSVLEKGGSTYVTPRVHGRNDLQEFTAIGAFAAMRSSGHEYSTTRKFFGMTSKQLDEDKDLNATYQLAMRGVLRDVHSSQHCNIYVFSKTQAEYLEKRFGGCKIIKAKSNVKDLSKQSTGRPATVTDKKAAAKGYVKTHRNKVQAEKKPKAPPLSAKERQANRRKRLKDEAKAANDQTKRTGT